MAVQKPPLLEDVPCDLCGGTGVRVLRPALPASRSPNDLVRIFSASAGSPLTDRLVACSRCGLVFVSPRVAAETIVASYAEGDDPGFVSQAEARERTFAGSLARMEALTGGPGHVFDVGTAGGSFLAAARARGWRIDGCEPNAWLAEWGRRRYGIDIRAGTLAGAGLPKDHYDAVTLWDVLEHVPHPSATLARVREIVRPGGFTFMTFPDIGSLPARLMGRRWPGFSAVHLYYFSKVTLGPILEKSGFQLLYTRPHMPRLELAFALNRGGDVLGTPIRLLSRLAEKAGAGRVLVPFWIGQTLAAARRTR